MDSTDMWFQSVSYTHLDVYKRQTLYSFYNKRCTLMKFRAAPVISILYIGFVSYGYIGLEG